MALTPEQEELVVALISRTQKTISQLEAETALLGDKIFPVENSEGTFALTVDELRDYILKYQDRKNLFINGAFDIWPEGASFSSVANGTYTAEGWVYAKSGAMVHTISRSSDVPTVAEAGRKFNHSLKISCTTVDASIASGDYAVIEQRVEGYNWLALAQKAGTKGIWVKATKIGTYGVYLKNSGGDRSYVGEITINASNTWEKKEVNFSASPSAGTWDYTNGIGVSVGITLAAGSTYQTTKDAWQTGGYLTTSNQVNACDSTLNDFYICGAQLEKGSVATAFEDRTIQEEIMLCQRYFEKSFPYSVVPAQNAGTAGTLATIAPATNARVAVRWDFKVTKRSSPSITTYNPSAANANFSANPLTPIVETADSSEINAWIVSTPANTTAANGYFIHATANSRL